MFALLALFVWLPGPVFGLPESCAVSGKTLVCSGLDVPEPSDLYTKVYLDSTWGISPRTVKDYFRNVRVSLQN